MYYHIIKLSYIFFHFGELNLFLSAVTNIICINWKKKKKKKKKKNKLNIMSLQSL